MEPATISSEFLEILARDSGHGWVKNPAAVALMLAFDGDSNSFDYHYTVRCGRMLKGKVCVLVHEKSVPDDSVSDILHRIRVQWDEGGFLPTSHERCWKGRNSWWGWTTRAIV